MDDSPKALRARARLCLRWAYSGMLDEQHRGRLTQLAGRLCLRAWAVEVLDRD